ncbi:MAG TPA: guanylate kinase [Candidatus Flavonifractor merdigallinarum]|uniref:Guanylate kinase n=1 Tax=Candidatus Flavonifractor merdigallinarum TaxID=2838589 RepID=A0A9D1YA47_9FIRM|nr:guanylate kinase [Candidatus Flavonifractor merdigallinarum]
MSMEKSYFDRIAEYGQLVVISGPNGVGKNTVIRQYLQEHPNACRSISVTTREPRPGEEEGKDYFFISVNEFDQLVRSKALLEHVYRDNVGYGTPRQAVENNRKEGHNVILNVDVTGAMKIRALCPDATLIFIIPPSWEELEKRVRASTNLSDEAIKEYLECAEEDILCAGQYDYILINDEVDKTVRRLGQIIHGNRYSRTSMQAFLESYIESEFKPHSDFADEILSM